MDYSKLKSAALEGAEDEEAVTVDTRALIDKVLARYSGEWTTLRELIQNAADAQAKTVTIRWETLPSLTVPAPPSTAPPSDHLKHVVTNHTIRRLVVRNDGQPFTRTDWARIKRIAEGNPDETKIGAFGVGFYSVFADCEEPFISSGDEAMAFYWKSNSLFTKKARLPDGHPGGRDTMFVLDHRNTTMSLPALPSVCQFLATSLTFVQLQRINLFVDDWCVLSLDKKSAPAVDVPIPRDLGRRTAQKLMEVMRIDQTSIQIDAAFMSIVGWKKPAAAAQPADGSGSSGTGTTERPSLRSFFRKLQSATSAPLLRSKAQNEETAVQTTIAEDVLQVNRSTIFLRAASAEIATRVPADFAAELERATKKPPPKTTRLSTLTATADEALASELSSSDNPVVKAVDIFASVLPSKKPGGRIFIGFPTMQTSGAGMHVSAPSIIPTVEREAIDLNARYIRLWNVELLRAVGIMARLAFAHEMEELATKMQRALDAPAKSMTPAIVARFMAEASHILSTYTFGDSTPSGQVAQIIEEAFWTCFNRASIEMYSSRGVMPTTKVRLGFEKLALFAADIPTVPDELKETLFVKKLTDFGLISPVTTADIQVELSNKTMSKEQTIHFIRWVGKEASTGGLATAEVQLLLDVAVCTTGNGDGDGDSKANASIVNIVPLGPIKNYLVASRIPPSMPLPPTTLLHALTMGLPEHELKAIGWQSLELVSWLQHLIDTRSQRAESESITKSADFAREVLTVMSKNWDNLSSSSRATVIDVLRNLAVMPTKLGLRVPSESFFSSVKLFDDLPIVTATNLKDKFLLALGVRKTLDLDTIIKRLLTPGETGKRKWSHVELVRYLASVQADIPADDMRKLRELKLVPAEEGDGQEQHGAQQHDEGTSTNQKKKGNDQKLYRVADLYEPTDKLRILGLPLLDWPGGRMSLDDGKFEFLYKLGLQRYPTVEMLLEMMQGDEPQRSKARRYFITNHLTNGYARMSLATVPYAIMPIEGNAEKLVRPSACYTNRRAELMGFDLLSRQLHDHAAKFGVARDPPMAECVRRLVAQPPADEKAAAAIFEYLASRLGDLNPACTQTLENAAFIPVVRKVRDEKRADGSTKSTTTTYVSPKRCYVGESAEYAEIFDFVTFGTDANLFLFKCGVRLEPSKMEVAEMLCTEPARLLGVLQTPERYLGLLKTLADKGSMATIMRNDDLWQRMKAAPMCLAYREVSVGGVGVGDGGGDGKDHTALNLDYDDDDDDTPQSMKQAQLVLAKDVTIKDDIISYSIFKDQLVCAPDDEAIEGLYHKLGAWKLSNRVHEDITVGPQMAGNRFATQLRRRVIERSKIFLHQFAQLQGNVRHDARWLERHILVEHVQTLSLRRVLKGGLGPKSGASHTATRSAASRMVANGSEAVLYVCGSERERVDMFQVGQAVCQLLLVRPGLHAYTTFEPILTLNLYDLRSRGYDVDRILKSKAEQARIAEEERRKALEGERRRVEEQRAEWEMRAAQVDKAKANEKGKETEKEKEKQTLLDVKDPQNSYPDMPGGFASPSPPPSRREKKKRTDFFSNLGRRLGFDTAVDSDNDAGGDDDDDDYDSGVGHNDTKKLESSRAGTAPEQQQQQQQQQHPQKPRDEGRVTNPATVRNNLLKAVEACRAHGSDEVFSQPTVEQVREQATYCDATPGQDLAFAGEAPNGMRLFFARNALSSPAPARAEFLAANVDAVSAFGSLLAELAGVYGLAERSVHMYYDEVGSTIAFNQGGSVFCNLRFYLQLHHHIAPDKNQQRTGSGAGLAGEDKAAAGVWWWVVLAHELAHNLCKAHNADHSFYTESFIQQYFPKMIMLTSRWQTAAVAAGGSRSDPGSILLPAWQPMMPTMPTTGRPIEDPPPYAPNPN